MLVMNKKFVTMRDFITALAAIIWHTTNTLWHKQFWQGFFSNYFKMIILWKRGPLRPQFLYDSLSPSPTLSYTITKELEKFAAQKLLKILKLLMFVSDRVLFKLLSDKVLFRVLSYRFHSKKGCSLGSSVFFFQYGTIFYQKRATNVSLKHVLLHYILKKVWWRSSWRNNFIETLKEYFTKFPVCK